LGVLDDQTNAAESIDHPRDVNALVSVDEINARAAAEITQHA